MDDYTDLQKSNVLHYNQDILNFSNNFEVPILTKHSFLSNMSGCFATDSHKMLWKGGKLFM